MIEWIFFPKSDPAPPALLDVIEAFKTVSDDIACETCDHSSDEVLSRVAPCLRQRGFRVESGKKAAEKIRVPVLFGLNGRPEKSFEADAYDEARCTVVEVEAGRGVMNNQFLKDLFEACMMHDVEYLAVALRRRYARSNDFQYVVTFMETLYASNRLHLPLKGVLVIGY